MNYQKALLVTRYLLFLISVLATGCVTADEKHKWEGISYPHLPAKFADGNATPYLANSEDGLHFFISFSWKAGLEDEKGFLLPDKKSLNVKLHYAEGPPIEAKENPFDKDIIGGYGNSRSMSQSYRFVFPWGKNEMKEAWFEVTLGQKTFWLEVPYGFTRNPDEKELPVSNEGIPKIPKAIEELFDSTTLVNWKHVYYDIGEIQNKWQASLYHSNPFDAKAELVLYRDDSKIGKSMYLWDLHDPRTKISIDVPEEYPVGSWCMGLRLHTDGFRRSDDFKFNRFPPNKNKRSWGKAIIEVNDRKWKVLMPSSLFRYIHGIAEPHHSNTIK